MDILHISDLHFGPPYVPAAGEALLRQAREWNPHAIVISGDFTQRAKASQFTRARAFLDQLPDLPTVVVPGNHDVPLYRVLERLFQPRALYQEHISQELDSVHRFPGVVMVGLDSTSPRRAISNGRIHRDQLDFCEAAFADSAPGDIKIVVTHHHFAPAPDYEKDQVMPQARRALDRFVDMGVEMILGGHLHRAYIGNSLDVYPGRKPDRGIIIVQSGTTTSRRGRARERERNSLNLVRLEEEIFEITHFLFKDHLEAFLPHSRHIFPRPGNWLQD
ncbi:MAG: metallophosphoesterase [Longimicrobiales bacterium]